ncbi:hypothetical protein EDC01DRAFT_635857 [Geopyxis carbonaria]|nr:hypothetical protein EDC01DRAFT_635857 [Geopyxis carbonaria]
MKENDLEAATGEEDNMNNFFDHHNVALRELNPVHLEGRLASDADVQGTFQSTVAPATTEYVCTVEGCGQVFPSYPKMRRHKEKHDIAERERECPLCAPGGRLWNRVDKLQE